MKAMLFDMDGVLVDSEPIHFAGRKRTLKRYGITITDDELYNYQSTSAKVFLRGIAQKRGVDIPIDEAAEFVPLDFKTEFDNSEIKPIEGIKNLLENLAAKNVPMAIASSSSPQLIREMVKRLDIEKYFTALVSGYEVKNGKPAPDIYLKVAEMVKIAPAECVVLEDSHNGVLAGKAAEMYCIGFRSPHSGNQDLTQADIIVNKISEIDLNLWN